MSAPTSQSGIHFLTKEYFQRILKTNLGADFEIIKFETSIGTLPGENYGSCFHLIKILVRSDSDLTILDRSYIHSTDKKGIYEVHLVAKTMPTNPYFIEVFNSKVTFQKESDFYSLLIPAFDSLCKKEGIQPVKFFPYCVHYEVFEDKNDAIIILEDLKVQGYSTENRDKGLSLFHAELVLHAIAWMHALSIALKLKNEESYKRIAHIVARNFWEGQDRKKILYPMMEPVISKLMGTIEKLPGMSIETLEKLKHNLKNELTISIQPDPPKEPYSAISHKDLWTNNIMFRNKDEPSIFQNCHPQCIPRKNPSDVKLVDFQMTAIRSPVHDVVFFLYTSVPSTIRLHHFKQLLEFYCHEFSNALKNLGCHKEAHGVTLEWFNNEVADNGPAILNQILIMLCVVHADKREKHAFSLSEDELLAGESLKATSDTYISETHSAVKDFISNRWI